VYAEQLAAMFARDGDQANGLFDMEATWFELEAAKCHADAGRQGRSLKYYRAVLTHFNQFVDDQFDFHGYCMRRSALRAYMDLLKVEDEMYARREFRVAASGAVQLYCSLFDDPPVKKAAALEEKIAAMPQEERRLFRQQLRKEEELAAKKEEERLAVLQQMMKEAAAKDSKNKGPKTEKKPDPDPIGADLEKTEEPLEEAMKFITPLLSHASTFEETQLLAFEVFIRQAKPILALKAVTESIRIAPESVRAKRNVARLARAVELMPETDAMKKVMMMQAAKLTDNKSSKDYAATLVGASAHPVDIAAAAQAQHDVSEDKSDAILIEGVKRTVIDGAKYSHGDYVKALDAYASASAAAADAFKAVCAVAFPYSCAFGGAKSTAAPTSE
jgi:peptide alpha-N-acetyltransferase